MNSMNAANYANLIPVNDYCESAQILSSMPPITEIPPISAIPPPIYQQKHEYEYNRPKYDQNYLPVQPKQRENMYHEPYVYDYKHDIGEEIEQEEEQNFSPMTYSNHLHFMSMSGIPENDSTSFAYNLADQFSVL